MANPVLEFFAPGTPLPEQRRPPGQSRARRGQKGRQRRSNFADPWKRELRRAACQAVDPKRAPLIPRYPMFPGRIPLALGLRFYVARPPSHYGTGRNADRVLPSAPRFPTSLRAGDLSNHVKATEDALGDWEGAHRSVRGAIVWRDDAQVIAYDPQPYMVYAEAGQPTGALIRVWEVFEVPDWPVMPVREAASWRRDPVLQARDEVLEEVTA